ncbi:MAG: PTS fructose transporter subunit IIA [Gammaproteobacteria bacterium]|jgi:mannose PTS system EIIA component|nr:PTS fructose transporter subunit IIA [Gammaproteobacteria bacterium]
MSVGILILSHSGVGSSLLGTAMHMITDSSMNSKLLTVERDCDPDKLIEHTKLLIEELDTGGGVLMLADLYGSTPCNIAKACAKADNVSAVAGLNLSMLIKIMNYPELGLAELVDKAISGGKEGIIQIINTDNHAN